MALPPPPVSSSRSSSPAPAAEVFQHLARNHDRLGPRLVNARKHGAFGVEHLDTIDDMENSEACALLA